LSKATNIEKHAREENIMFNFPIWDNLTSLSQRFTYFNSSKDVKKKL